MIRVTVELVSAVTGKTSTLGIMKISNDVLKTHQTQGWLGDYNASLSTKGGRRFWKSARVVDFPRKRLLAWDLLYRVLREVVGSRN